MIIRSSVALIVCMSLSAPMYAADCDKFKGEWTTAGWHTSQYIARTKDYNNQTLSYASYLTDGLEIANKLSKLQKKVAATPACSHKKNKFQKRKDRLLTFIKYAVPLMKTGQAAMTLKAFLKKEEKKKKG